MLRSWDPARGLGFLGFIGLIAEREVGMRMRTMKRLLDRGADSDGRADAPGRHDRRTKGMPEGAYRKGMP